MSVAPCDELHELLAEGERILSKAGVADAKMDAWYLLESVTAVTKAEFLCDRNQKVSKKDRLRYLELIGQRASRIPLQYITGEQEFMGFPFKVNRHVLIPRQDTETLVEEVMKDFRISAGKLRVLDMCTGSGCIIISLKKLLHCVQAVGADISGDALKVARENALKNQAEVILIESDMFSALELGEGFDVLVSNPPYIETAVIQTLEPEVQAYEPLSALDGKEDGLHFYKILAKEAGRYLKSSGHIYLEIGYNQAKEVSGLLEQNGFWQIETVKDLTGFDRVVKGIKG